MRRPRSQQRPGALLLGCLLLLTGCSFATDSGGGGGDRPAETPAPSDTPRPDPTPQATSPDASADPSAQPTPEPSAEPECAPGLRRCGGRCVNISEDPLHCGGCNAGCTGGELCNEGRCQMGDDCSVAPCTGLSYCDLNTMRCVAGCISDEPCGENQACDRATRTCVCAAGFHDCGGVCVSDAEPATCGNRCTPCPGAANGAPACAEGRCTLACRGGFHACGARCASDDDIATCGSRCEPCPADPLGELSCVAGQCTSQCGMGSRNCDGRCAACPQRGATEVTCAGGACVATACEPGFWLCDGDCCDGFRHRPILSDSAAERIDATQDSTGRMFVSLYRHSDEAVLLLSEGNDGFSPRTIIAGLEATSHTGIEVDADDHWHLLYFDSDRGMLVDQRSRSTGASEVYGNGNITRSGAFELWRSPAGTIHTAFMPSFRVSGGGGFRNVIYARWNGSWDTDSLSASFASPANAQSAAADSEGRGIVTVRTRTQNLLVYRQQGRSWSDSVTAGSNGSRSNFFSVSAADAEDRHHLFYKHDDRRPRYAVGQTLEEYGVETVGDGALCDEGDMVLRPDGTAFAACYDREAARIWLGVRTATGWLEREVATGVDVPYRGIALVITASGHPRVVWADGNGPAIRLAEPGVPER